MIDNQLNFGADMELRMKSFLTLCLIVAALPITQVKADYYNNALAPAYRTTRINMKNAGNKTVGSIVTPIKNQGEFGTCWAFATNAAVETSLMKQIETANALHPGLNLQMKQFNFSEKYTAWMTYALASSENESKDPHAFFVSKMPTSRTELAKLPTNEPDRTAFANLDHGGGINHELSVLMGNFLVETTANKTLDYETEKAKASNNTVASVVSPTYKARDIYTRYGENNLMGINLPTEVSKLSTYKDLLKTTGSLRVNFDTDGFEPAYSTGAAYNSKFRETNSHAVLVVGYDDDYDFSNSTLEIKPTEKGAWIVKNSWGTTMTDGRPMGDAGYFYISYYDKSLVFSTASVIEPDVARYTLTDTHTPLFTNTSINAPNPASALTLASTYSPKDSQFLKAVSFFTKTDDASYTIDILSNTKNPGSKPVYSMSGDFAADSKMSGYHTVDLGKFILVPKGESYTIRVTITAKNGVESIYTAISDNAVTSNLNFNNGESYYKFDNGQWSDTNKERDASVILNGQAKQTNLANGGDFTVGSLSCDKNSGVVINLGKASELYGTDILNPTRTTLSNMTADISDNENFWGTITGEGGVTKTGTGELSLRDNNTYTGITNVNQGILSNLGSTGSNVDVKNGAKYGIINTLNQTINQRGINNEGTAFIAADKKGIISFANTGDILSGTSGNWYLNTLDETLKAKATTGTIVMNANTNDVKGNVYIQGGTIKIGSGQTNLFTNALKQDANGVKIDSKNQTLSDVNLGKMVVTGTTELDTDVNLSQSALTSDLIKGTVVKADGITEDDTANKIKLGFTLDKDVTFTDKPNGVSTIVAQGQIAKDVNNTAFAIDRNEATGSYNVAYSCSGTDGTLNIKNADAPTSIQDAITSTVTSKYYAPSANQVLTSTWDANLKGNDLTLVGNNTVIDGDKKTQVFNVSADKMLNLKDISITQGKETAINNEGTLALSSVNSDVKLTQNDGTDGGAISNKGVVKLRTSGNNINFQNNTATNGAGIFNDAIDASNQAKVTASAEAGDIVFDNNVANTSGGAVYNKGDLSLLANGGNIQVTTNKAQSGAGVYNTGSLSINTVNNEVNFNNNAATANGGAILNDGGNVDILNQGGNVSFSQNQAANGGAIYNTKTGVGADSAVVNLIAETGNITFDGNKATANGGAIYNTETVNVLALENQKVSFNQSTDSIYNTGIINLNYNNKYGSTKGVISTGAELGGTGTYNLYGGELAFVTATNNPTTVGSISNASTLSIMNNATLNLANGVKETFNPGALIIADKSALFVAIDCTIKGNSAEADFLNAGTYTGGTTSQIIIAAVNLLKSSEANKDLYRINIAGNTIQNAISRNILATINGYTSAYSANTGDLILISSDKKWLNSFVLATDAQRTYSMDEDELVIFQSKAMGGENSTLTINGNNKKIVSEFSDIDGVTVSATNTLNANNVSFDNFHTAITNNGTLNLDNVSFHGQNIANVYDVNNTNTMTATNTVSGSVLNSGTFNAGKVNDFSNLAIKNLVGSNLDLSNTTNNINFKDLTIAGNVNLYINGVNKLSSTTATRAALIDSLVIKGVSEMKSQSSIVTDTAVLMPFIKIADDVAFTLTDAAKPIGAAYNAYKLIYSDTTGTIAVNGADISDATEKSGSFNIAKAANFVASATNSIATGKTVTLTGATSDIEIKLANDTTVSGTLGLNGLVSSGNKIIVDNSTTAALKIASSTVNNALLLNGGSTEVKNSDLKGDINMKATAVLSFVADTSNTKSINTVDGAITGVTGSSLVVGAQTRFNGTVDPISETVNSYATHNANVSGVNFTINNGGILGFTKDSYLNNDNTNTLNFNGGSLNLINGVASTITLNSLNFSATSNSDSTALLFVDVDLANKAMDKLVSIKTPSVGSGAILSIAGMHLLSDAKGDNTSINFTEDAGIKGIVETNISSLVYSPIYKYLVDYDSSNGNFNFARSYNPAVLASSVAAQIGSYLTQVNTYEQAFGNMDMMMSMTSDQRQAMKFANKIASAGNDVNLGTFSPNQIPEEAAGVWYKPYATFENVPLNNGPTVGNISYGSLFGGDTPIMELKNGWNAVYSAYAGYNGSNQNYEGVGIDQNGATLGATGLFYKNNFFTGLTANVGANATQAYTMYGKENFTMLAAGIASKTGYNWELNGGKFIIQPNYLMSYSFINTFNYTNAGGVNITSDPLNAIQITPGIKFIGNLKNGWQPYASVQMVWNLMDQSKFSANDVSLPEMSVKPYVQYGIGLQRRWDDRFTGYGQAMIRNGGRNGIALQFGFRYALGKASRKTISDAKDALKNERAMLKKCNINLQSYKSEEPILKKTL